MFRFSVQRTTVRTMEPISALLPFVVVQITLMLMMNGGWKIYALAATGALLFAFVDLILLNSAWRAAIYFHNRIKSMFRAATPVNFTVKLTCPSCRNDFQAKVLLPVTVEHSHEKTMFGITEAVPLEVQV